MKLRNLLGLVLCGMSLAACGPVLDQPYQSCGYGEACAGGTVCAQTTLPASAGFTGALCTSSCVTSNDCLQDLSNYAAICVNSQCYIECPTGGYSCPYGTGCISFSDQNGYLINLCTP